MIELPEAVTLSRQVAKALAGRAVTSIHGATHLHKFTFFNASISEYEVALSGQTVISAEGKGIFVNILLENGMSLAINDGINMRYHKPGAVIPSKYQMLITFDDGSFVVFTTSMYGTINLFRQSLDNKYWQKSMGSISPLSADFGDTYFAELMARESKSISVKGLLATEQRIPGLGNGVLQDILFNALIHPKRKISTLKEAEKERLFLSVKSTLMLMTEKGGRDTEPNFFGERGGYTTILSKNTYGNPCPRCGGAIVKETYMGGTAYYCSSCQPL